MGQDTMLFAYALATTASGLLARGGDPLTMSHSAAPWDTSHWLSVRALVRLILIENGCRSKE